MTNEDYDKAINLTVDAKHAVRAYMAKHGVGREELSIGKICEIAVQAALISMRFQEEKKKDYLHVKDLLVSKRETLQHMARKSEGLRRETLLNILKNFKEEDKAAS